MSQGVECYSCLPKTAWPPTFSTCPHNPPYARYLLDYANAQMDILFGSRPEKAPPRLSYEQKKRLIDQDLARAKAADREALYNGEGN